jgi:hypothetical protein
MLMAFWGIFIFASIYELLKFVRRYTRLVREDDKQIIGLLNYLSGSHTTAEDWVNAARQQNDLFISAWRSLTRTAISLFVGGTLLLATPLLVTLPSFYSSFLIPMGGLFLLTSVITLLNAVSFKYGLNLLSQRQARQKVQDSSEVE